MKAGMADNITLYDILGVPAGASADTLRQARDERARQLRPGLEAGAPSPVVAAAARAREAVELASLVLSDPEARLRYDRQIGLHRNRGLRGSSVFGEGAP
jgi:curved DNA-binding protein CbpA